jgi:hypothetical protein
MKDKKWASEVEAHPVGPGGYVITAAGGGGLRVKSVEGNLRHGAKLKGRSRRPSDKKSREMRRPARVERKISRHSDPSAVYFAKSARPTIKRILHRVIAPTYIAEETDNER